MRAIILALLLGAPAAAQTVITTPKNPPSPTALPDVPGLAAPLVSPPIVTLPDVTDGAGDAQYKPTVGQGGKDVVWVPTPPALIEAMLRAAKVQRDDLVVDLGSGDGRIAIAAARDFGARAMGIEYNPELVALARRQAVREGVAGRVTFQAADIFRSDFSRADVVTLYLLPHLNLKLRPILLAMRPGTRIVSHAFDMADWRPDQVLEAAGARGYLWIVPARVEGRWRLEGAGPARTLALSQQFQTLSAPGLRDGRLDGARVTLTLPDGRTLRGLVENSFMQGDGWRATRLPG